MNSPLVKLFAGNAAKPARFEVVAAAEEATLYLYGSIGGYWEDSINAASAVKEIAAIKSPVIHVRIQSRGGDITAARAIMTALAMKKPAAKVIAHVDGLAASAASLVMLAGDEIEATKGAFVMIHNAWGFTMGDSRAHLESAALLEKFTGTLADDYAARSKKDRDQICSWMDAETWFTADEAVEHGFVDRVVDTVAAQAQWDLSAYAHAPASLVAGSAKQAQTSSGNAATAAKPREEVNNMADQTAVANGTAKQETPPMDTEAIRAEASQAANERDAQIAELCALANLPGMAAALIKSDKDLDTVRADIRSARARLDAENHINTANNAEQGVEHGQPGASNSADSPAVKAAERISASAKKGE